MQKSAVLDLRTARLRVGAMGVWSGQGLGEGMRELATPYLLLAHAHVHARAHHARHRDLLQGLELQAQVVHTLGREPSTWSAWAWC